MSQTLRRCPSCRNPIPSGMRGLCPRCTLRFTLSDTAVDSDAETATAPEAEVASAVVSGAQLPPAAARGAFSGTTTWEGPRRFGEYELLRELGRGGMGVVYQARHRRLNRVVALKMLHPSRLSSAAQLQRFRQEAEAVAALDHPNILAVFEVGELQGQPYFTMKLAERGSLIDQIRTHPPRPPGARGTGSAAPESRKAMAAAVTTVAAIARAVHYAHLRGIQHRDLKPHNILIDASGRPFVSDFGLAKFEDRETGLTVSTDVLGSPAYMSPEQAAGDSKNVTSVADVYGLGAILYETLSGRPPFVGETVATVLRRIVEDDPDPTPLTDRDLRTVCLKCLQKDPRQRYSSAEALAEELERWLRGDPILARPATTLEQITRWTRRRPALTASLAALALALVAGVIGITVQWQRAEEHSARREVERYAADLQVASQALAGHDLGLARRVLAAQIPGPGETDRRGLEWHLLQTLCAGQQSATLTGHTATVTCVAVSPDGRHAVSGGMDATIRFWDLRTGVCLTNRTDHRGVVWSVVFTPDGKQVISAGADGRLRAWTPEGRGGTNPAPHLAGLNAALSADGSTLAAARSSPFRFFRASRGVTVWDWPSGRRRFETNLPVRRVALSPDGAWLAAGGERKDIYLWNTRTHEARVITTPDTPWALTFSPDGRRLAASGFSLGARVWNLAQDLSAPLVLGGHEFKVWGIAFSPDSRRIVTTGSDRTLRVCDLDQPDRALVLDGHDDEVWDVAWTPDGRRLLTASKDMSLRLWPATAGAGEVSIPCRDSWKPTFSRSGQRILTLNDTPNGQTRVVLRSLADSSIVAEFPSRWHAGFGPNGEDVVLIPETGDTLEYWRAASGQLERGPAWPSGAPGRKVRHFAFSRDGTALALANEREILVLRLPEEKRVAQIPLPAAGPVLALCLSPDGQQLAFTLSSPYTIWLRHLPSGRERQLIRHTEEVKDLAFSPDGRTLASAGVDRVIGLWRTDDGQLRAELVRYFEEATGVGFSDDGRLLASIGAHQSVSVWHLETSREVFALNTPNAGERVTFLPDLSGIVYGTDADKLRVLRRAAPAQTGPRTPRSGP